MLLKIETTRSLDLVEVMNEFWFAYTTTQTSVLVILYQFMSSKENACVGKQGIGDYCSIYSKEIQVHFKLEIVALSLVRAGTTQITSLSDYVPSHSRVTALPEGILLTQGPGSQLTSESSLLELS